MAIFVDEATRVIVQGLTGGQGRFHGVRNRDYGTKVVGGVTPGKGGEDVEGIPVFDSVKDAVGETARRLVRLLSRIAVSESEAARAQLALVGPSNCVIAVPTPSPVRLASTTVTTGQFREFLRALPA